MYPWELEGFRIVQDLEWDSEFRETPCLTVGAVAASVFTRPFSGPDASCAAAEVPTSPLLLKVETADEAGSDPPRTPADPPPTGETTTTTRTTAAAVGAAVGAVATAGSVHRGRLEALSKAAGKWRPSLVVVGRTADGAAPLTLLDGNHRAVLLYGSEDGGATGTMDGASEVGQADEGPHGDDGREARVRVFVGFPPAGEASATWAFARACAGD
jgi:hypothetical protein